MPFVYSTMSAPVEYTNFRNDHNDQPLPTQSVLVNGHANVVERKNLITPLGVRTEVSEKMLEALKGHEVFKRHVANGFISFDNEKVDPEVRAADLKSRDDSAPFTDNDFIGTDAEKVAQPKDLDALTGNRK